MTNVHTMALPFTLKKESQGKRRRIMKTQIFHHAKNIIFKKKNPRKESFKIV